MDKTMVPWTKLWYFTKNYKTLIYEGKNKHVGLPNTKKLLYMMKKNYGNIPK